MSLSLSSVSEANKPLLLLRSWRTKELTPVALLDSQEWNMGFEALGAPTRPGSLTPISGPCRSVWSVVRFLLQGLGGQESIGCAGSSWGGGSPSGPVCPSQTVSSAPPSPHLPCVEVGIMEWLVGSEEHLWQCPSRVWSALLTFSAVGQSPWHTGPPLQRPEPLQM